MILSGPSLSGARNFKDLIKGYLSYTEGHESTERVRKWSVISCIAACLERRVYMDRGYYPLFPNLYVFIIGKSGLIKKTTSTGIAVSLLREVSGLRVMSERLTASGLIEQMVMAGKKYDINGVSYRQSAVFAYASELSVFLTEVFGSITELLTTFYDCVPHDSAKPWTYTTIGRGDKKIYGPCLNILGASTKAWLARCIPRSEMEGGFTSRIIFVVENKLPKKLIAWPKLPDDEVLTKLRLIEDFKSIYALHGEMKPTQEARDIFEKWYCYHMTEILPQNSDPRMVGYMSRKGDTILKLAMVHSASRGDDMMVTLEDLKWANIEIDLLEDDWRLAFDGVGSVSNLGFSILDFVKKKIKVKKKDLMSEFGQTNHLPEIVKTLAELKGMDEIEEIVEEKDGKRVDYFCLPGWEEYISLKYET